MTKFNVRLELQYIDVQSQISQLPTPDDVERYKAVCDDVILISMTLVESLELEN